MTEFCLIRAWKTMAWFVIEYCTSPRLICKYCSLIYDIYIVPVFVIQLLFWVWQYMFLVIQNLFVHEGKFPWKIFPSVVCICVELLHPIDHHHYVITTITSFTTTSTPTITTTLCFKITPPVFAIWKLNFQEEHKENVPQNCSMIRFHFGVFVYHWLYL